MGRQLAQAIGLHERRRSHSLCYVFGSYLKPSFSVTW